MLEPHFLKYHKDAPFTDPVLRCDSCTKIVRAERIRKLGSCKCGNRKFRNLLTFSLWEYLVMKFWGVDPDFLKIFEGAK